RDDRMVESHRQLTLALYPCGRHGLRADEEHEHRSLTNRTLELRGPNVATFQVIVVPRVVTCADQRVGQLATHCRVFMAVADEDLGSTDPQWRGIAPEYSHDGDAGPLRDDLGDVFLADHRLFAALVPMPAGLERRDAGAQVDLAVAQLRSLSVVLILDGLIL